MGPNAQAQPGAARSEAEGCTSAGAPGYAAVARNVPVSLNEANCAAGDHQQNLEKTAERSRRCGPGWERRTESLVRAPNEGC